MEPTLLCDPVECELVGVDGNAFSLMGHWSKHARRAGRTKEQIDSVMKAAMNGDYDNLLCVLANHCK